MVGVPGKSKGCSTCRRRKKGCDQKRPVCGQCSASGYVCGGYQRDLTFVLHPASKAVETAIFLPTRPRPSLSTTTLSLERSAIISQCQDLFFDVYLPKGKCLVTDQFLLKCGRPANWTHLMRSFAPNDASLELAFAAFSISRVGRHRDDPRLIKESTKFYGKALKHLQKALYDPSRMRSEQVLTACLLLGLYETFEGAGGKSVGWVSHAQGAARIVELRGPERHAESPAHILFLGTRLSIIYSAILRRKKTFLSDEDWLTVPWRREFKTGLDRLIDVVTHVPGLLEQFDVVRAQMSSTAQRQSLQACLAMCRQLQKSLQTWTTVRRPNSEAIPVKHDPVDSTDTYPFAQELTYENHLFLNANLILWSAALVIATTVSEIEFLLASFGFQSTSMLSSTATAIQEAQECANNIAQSIPYCLDPDMGDLGVDYIQFPMTLAFQFFMKSNNAAVCSWMLEKAKEMQKGGSTRSSTAENSPAAYTGADIGLSMFSTPGPSARVGVESTYTSTTVHPSPAFVSAEGPPVPILHSSEQGNHKSSNANPKCSSDSIDPGPVHINPNFDAGYDEDSDYEARSSNSNHSGPPSATSRQGSSGPSGSMTVANGKTLADMNDYTFIQENPGRCYIDRTEFAIRARA